MADNTVIGAATTPGDMIATEDNPAGAFRGIDSLPLTAYKMPRSKIAVGSYDVDGGDATPTNPSPVESLAARRAADEMLLQGFDATAISRARKHSERLSFCDSRGSTGQRGTRR